jgi:RimJ/RimL family protein N-acetyltransferase
MEVRLRQTTADDLPILFEHQEDPEATAMAVFPPRDWDRFEAHWTTIIRDESLTTRTVIVDGRVAGNAVSWDGPTGREVGYWIGREFWGRGIATLALMELVREVQIRPLSAHVAKTNIGSRRVLEKCGFRVVSEGRVDEVDELVLRLDAEDA